MNLSDEQIAALRRLAKQADVKYRLVNAPAVILQAIARINTTEEHEQTMEDIGVLIGCPYNQFIDIEETTQ